MSFLDAFDPEQRALFESVAERVDLPRGHYLLRRGEPGGDVYLLVEGTLEVLDTRHMPEVIVASMDVGAIVGEMAFIDDSPRSLDVRAGLDCVVLRWARDDLRSLLKRHPALASRFYETMAREASSRIRRLTEGAVRGAFQRSETVSQEGLQRVRDEARNLAEHVKTRFLEVETQLRTNANDQQAVEQVRSLLDRLQGSVHDLFTKNPEKAAGDIAAEVLCRELHPYLVRSGLAERCIRRPQGVTGTAEILAHVLVNTPGGDGLLGEVLDRWLLDRPTLTAIRDFRQPAIAMIARRLPSHRNRRVLVLNAGTGSLVSRLSETLSTTPTVVTVMDQSRDALAFIGAAGLNTHHKGIEVATVQENLAQFAMGRARNKIAPQDAILVHGVVEYLPERIAVSLVQHCRELLHDDGVLVCSALGPSDDREILDRLLTWPTLRRTPDALRRVFRSGGMTIDEEAPLPPPGQLVAAVKLDTSP